MSDKKLLEKDINIHNLKLTIMHQDKRFDDMYFDLAVSNPLVKNKDLIRKEKKERDENWEQVFKEELEKIEVLQKKVEQLHPSTHHLTFFLN